MVLSYNGVVHTVGVGRLKFKLLASGDIYAITYGDEQISMYRASTLAGALGNLYLKISNGDDFCYTPLIGAASPATATVTATGVIYRGSFAGINYTVRLSIGAAAWFWTVRIEGGSHKHCEIFYGQDLCLQRPHLNEAYVSQYLDHRPLRRDNGYHIITKQNEGPPLVLQQGTLTENVAYGTDGFSFFGCEYKRTNIPKAIKDSYLPSKVYQYELAYISFKTPQMKLENGTHTVFYAMLRDGTETELAAIDALYRKTVSEESESGLFLALKPKINFQKTYPYRSLSNRELNRLFPERELEEKTDDLLLSWFMPDGSHCMSGIKEDYSERPGGHIIINHAMKPVGEKLICSTNYIFGVFNSQVCFGNTQFNRLLTYNKTPLNILKTSGQRLFVKIGPEYRLLALPAVYRMTVNSAAWYYKIDDDVLIVEAGAAADEPRLVLSVRSECGRFYDFILTNELVMADIEHRHRVRYDVKDNQARFYFVETTLTASLYPEYYFLMRLNTNGNYRFFRDELFFPDGKRAGNMLFSAKIDRTSAFTLDIAGMAGPDENLPEININTVKKEYGKAHRDDCNHFRLEIKAGHPYHREIKKMNYLVYWYLHNGLIHYAAPHGLEQYGGGAWGTRDVCQGPAELFSAFNRYDLIKRIIITVYSRQFYETHDWPQWFMFDRFRSIQADSSHADIIVWPLYLLGKYIKDTGDMAILDKVVPYTKKTTGEPAGHASVYEHIMRQLDVIEKNFIAGTALSSYGSGDWNDTLQPKDQKRKNKMVSGWTVALTIEALSTVGAFIDDERISQLAAAIKKDYCRYLIKDDIPAGFVEMGENGKINYLLHPADRETGIKYRLLSFNRGMIAELFSEENLLSYLEIIDRNLMHPDGVRLMDRAVFYRGGAANIFTRAETAANFGREIGLLYVHAHLRYCEAMAKLGEADRLFTALRVVNPILINENVEKALPRQSNVYFSSSDAAFMNRYEANCDFEQLRRGKVFVKGGWRLYSSGPGIWLHQLINNMLGIKQFQGELYIDPVLPQSLNGLRCHYRYGGYYLELTYDISGTSGVEYVLVNSEKIVNNTALTKYRRSGVIIPRNYLQKHNKITVKM